jgi:hypothetical protein
LVPGETTVLVEASVIVGATVFKTTVLVEIYVTVGASCSEVYVEVCVTLGH